ncbi:MAG: hypothetical protein HC889_10125, partial [Synechococcaceae cyanobacterium SM1_2_3]|nr:hypothetical protein [Synechococcaceae cyanobacterium SM1_2_3]
SDLAFAGRIGCGWLPPGGPIRAGIAEELVLDGAFQAAFESAGVEFDAHGGHFKVHNPTRGVVDLAGEGLPALWTGRALEREGFIVNGHGGPRSALHIEVHDRSGQPMWRLHHAETWQDFPTLSQAMSGVKACFSPAIAG